MEKKTINRFKRILGLLLASLITVTPINMQLKAAEAADSSGLLCVEDDFNRADGSIDGNNGWFSQYTVLDPPGEHTIQNGVLMAKDFSGGNGAATRNQPKQRKSGSETILDGLAMILRKGDDVKNYKLNSHGYELNTTGKKKGAVANEKNHIATATSLLAVKSASRHAHEERAALRCS